MQKKAGLRVGNGRQRRQWMVDPKDPAPRPHPWTPLQSCAPRGRTASWTPCPAWHRGASTAPGRCLSPRGNHLDVYSVEQKKTCLDVYIWLWHEGNGLTKESWVILRHPSWHPSWPIYILDCKLREFCCPSEKTSFWPSIMAVIH